MLVTKVYVHSRPMCDIILGMVFLLVTKELHVTEVQKWVRNMVIGWHVDMNYVYILSLNFIKELESYRINIADWYMKG